MMIVCGIVCLALFFAFVDSDALTNDEDSLICSAQCYAKCLHNAQGSTSHCDAAMPPLASCECHYNESGFIPPLPRLDILHRIPLTLGWPNNEDSLVCLNCVYVLQRFRNNSVNAKWEHIMTTTDVQYESDDNCQPQFYRLAAVSPDGCMGFSDILPVAGLLVPDPVYGLQWTSNIMYKDGYFEAAITWGLPRGWSEEEIQKYDISSKVVNKEPGSVIAAPIFKLTGNNSMVIKLFKTTYGMVYELHILAVSHCSIKGEPAVLRMDLMDCNTIQNFECPNAPTTPAGPPELAGSPTIRYDEDNDNVFIVSWRSDSSHVDRYALQWGTYYTFMMFVLFDRIINETILWTPVTSARIDTSEYQGKDIGVRIVPLAEGQAPPTSDDFGFSKIWRLNDPSLLVPGPVHGLHWTSNITYKGDVFGGGYFEAVISWDLPKGWSHADIQRYESSSKVVYKRPESIAAMPIFKSIHNNSMAVKLFHTAYGIIYDLRIIAFSRSSVKGDPAVLRMDLTDCKAIQKFECPEAPTTTAAPPELIGSPTVRYEQGNDKVFIVSWRSDSSRVDRCALQWGTYTTTAYNFRYFDLVINETVVWAPATSARIDTSEYQGKEVGIRIVPLAEGQLTPDNWGFKEIYPLRVKYPAVENPESPGMSGYPPNDSVNAWNPPAVNGSKTTSVKIDMTTENPLIKPPDDNEEPAKKVELSTSPIVLAISLPCSLVVIIVVIAAVAGTCFKQKAKRTSKANVSFIDNNFNFYKSVIANERNPLYPQCSLIDDEFEISPNCLELGDMLGQGAFGMVREAKLLSGKWLPKDTTVAVKMLLDLATDNQKQEFLQEIIVMKNLGKHANIVSMVGYCSVCEPMFVVVEHMCNGDLVHFLRQHRTPSAGDVSNKRQKLTYQDLLSFARQISIGMEFLSQKGYVHRDLAARNVLVGDNRNIKIGDFGLTRYIYNDKVYFNRRGGKLPLKWMSIEAISDLTFTSASDVWSFGVLLFELVTLGGTPYPTMSNFDLLRELKAGFRMERPQSCPKQLYSIMVACWCYQPNERPTFTKLRNIFDGMLQACSPADYLDLTLDIDKDYYRMRGSSESTETSASVWTTLEGGIESSSGENVHMAFEVRGEERPWNDSEATNSRRNDNSTETQEETSGENLNLAFDASGETISCNVWTDSGTTGDGHLQHSIEMQDCSPAFLHDATSAVDSGYGDGDCIDLVIVGKEMHCDGVVVTKM